MQSFSERAAEAAGLRPRQYQLLLMLRALGPGFVDGLRQLLEPTRTTTLMDR